MRSVSLSCIGFNIEVGINKGIQNSAYNWVSEIWRNFWVIAKYNNVNVNVVLLCALITLLDKNAFYYVLN